jgi:hypothetical protein
MASDGFQQTGVAYVRFGLDEEGDEVYAWGLEGVSEFEAWAGLQLVADRLHRALLDRGGESDDDTG